MKLDSQTNVYFGQGQQQAGKGYRSQGQNSHSQALYHRYLQLYEQYQMQTKEFDDIDQEQTRNQAKKQQYKSDYSKKHITNFDLFQQNKALKEQLRLAYTLIRSLKDQLSRCNQELDEMRRINQENEITISSKHEYILQELQALLQNKSLLDQQVEYLKSQMKNNIKPLPINNYNQKAKITQSHALLHSDTSTQICLKNDTKQKRQKQFIKSIQGMYQTILGKTQTDLISIWRWLKQMALSYSKFMKWKKTNQKRIAAASSQPLGALTLLNQLKLIN